MQSYIIPGANNAIMAIPVTKLLIGRTGYEMLFCLLHFFSLFRCWVNVGKDSTASRGGYNTIKNSNNIYLAIFDGIVLLGNSCKFQTTKT